MTTIEKIRQQQNRIICLQSAAEWEALADRKYAGTEYFRETCRRTAHALRIEAETGIAYCSCCLKPRGTFKPGQSHTTHAR